MNEQLEYEYGCREFSELFGSLSERCLAGPIVNDFRSMQCCNETRCNEHLMPSPPYLFRTTTSPVQDPTTALSSETGIKSQKVRLSSPDLSRFIATDRVKFAAFIRDQIA